MPHRKKGRTALILLFLFVVAAAAWTQVRPLPSPTSEVTLKVPAANRDTTSLAWPSYGQAAIGTAGYGVIASNGTQKAVPTASLAKIVTALAVLHQYPLNPGESGPLITIKQADVDSYNAYVKQDGSVAKVSLGEQISERQALEALLLPSANNMADTLATWAFGSIKGYTTYANDYAKSLGLKSVVITDPSGFDPTTVASASDMVVIGETALLDPVLASIVAKPSATIPVAGTVQNYNTLLGDGFNTGIKTGNSDQDKGAFLSAYRIVVDGQAITVVGAIMDGPDLPTVLQDSNKLAQSAGKQFTRTTFVQAGQTVAKYHLADGRVVNAVADASLTALVWSGSPASASVDVRALAVPSPRGAAVGDIMILTGPNHTKTVVGVHLQNAATPPSRIWRLLHPF